VLSSRERPIAIHPLGLGLQGVTLRYPYEVRREAEYFDQIEPLTLPKDMIELAHYIVTTMKADFIRPRSMTASAQLWWICSRKSSALCRSPRTAKPRPNPCGATSSA
jgi:non-homologous end joining protein Ku